MNGQQIRRPEASQRFYVEKNWECKSGDLSERDILVYKRQNERMRGREKLTQGKAVGAGCAGLVGPWIDASPRQVTLTGFWCP